MVAFVTGCEVGLAVAGGIALGVDGVRICGDLILLVSFFVLLDGVDFVLVIVSILVLLGVRGFVVDVALPLFLLGGERVLFLVVVRIIILWEGDRFFGE